MLDSLAVNMGISQTAVIETLIRDRRPSDRHLTAKRRHRAWGKCVQASARLSILENRSLEDPPINLDFFELRRIFNDGYAAGWIDFQNRHIPDDL